MKQGLGAPLVESELPALGPVRRGKVRDSYDLDAQRCFIVTTDRISAFDRGIGTLPFKGQVLNQLSAFWFRHIENSVPHHMLSMPDPNAMVCRKCRPLPVEFVVRGYLTGVTETSVWTHYARGVREFCGYSLPEGMQKNQPLPESILTPSTKGEQHEHDRSLSRKELLALTRLDAALFDQAAALSLKLFALGQQHCATKGLLLVDTKYEFGLDPEGTLRLIDEVHTPDSSRFWLADSYAARMSRHEEPESLDKEYVRRHLVGLGYKGEGTVPNIDDSVRMDAAERYIRGFEMITGLAFEANLEHPTQRLQRAVIDLTKD